MTPRPEEKNLNDFVSKLILSQTTSPPTQLNLTTTAPLLAFMHPRMTRALGEFLFNPQQETSSTPNLTLPCAFFSSTHSAQKVLLQLPVLRGNPHSIGHLLDNRLDEAIFDLAPYGAAAITIDRQIGDLSEPGLHQRLLLPFIEYAIGAELWGPQGKWRRFHQRLYNLLAEKDLLIKDDGPGRYLMRTSANRLEKFGILGTQEEHGYSLTLPWTFSLTSLNYLEKILKTEF